MFSEFMVFWKHKANVVLRRSVLKGESADVPENIIVAWSLRFPRYAMATSTPRKPFSVWTILLCIAICRPYTCVPTGAHVKHVHPGK